MRMRLGAALLTRPSRLKALWLLLVCALLGCGRFGVLLQPASDAGRVPDAGGPYMGCDASNCDEPTAMDCNDPASVPPQGICGCGRSDQDDSDNDGTPDCIDFCPGARDLTQDAECACAAAQEDADGDGTTNCADRCPFDPQKTEPGMCGCSRSDADRDGDGVPDCIDECDDDPDKSVAGVCDCGTSDLDSDLDGTPDCNDRCSGANDATYEPISDCGAGYCRQTNTASMCVAGMESACIPGMPLAAADSTCNNLDDDCDGRVDEDYDVNTHSCGLGVCARMGDFTCESGVVVDSCVIGDPRAADDSTCDNEDDDCDGLVDENVPSAPSSCGPGACASVGSIECVAGQMVDSCQASSPISTTDTTCNNVDDNCNDAIDDEYVPTNTSCGVGACARTGMLTCTLGTEVDSCTPAQPAVTVDSSCNNTDDDCDGRIDEQYVTTTLSCGRGICTASGSRRCQNGVVVDSCTAGTPRPGADDPAVPGDGLDNDCDGKVDENLPACDTTPRTYEAGSYALTIPGNCRRVTVRLWGGGGGGGQNAGIAGSGATGGPGGYATASVLVQAPLQLFVGAGASNNCNTGGTNAGSASYSGGAGGTGTGANGQDGAVSGGGTGGSPSSGQRGGNGHYGGGGAGQGDGGLGASGSGGGGGAASVLIVNGVIAAVAGGGGGGGGGQSLSVLGTLSASGGKGGSGCRGNGQAPNANGGGGGGGGMCSGSSTQAGSDVDPAQSGDIPSGRARGGSSNCGGGGNGYAIVTFSPS